MDELVIVRPEKCIGCNACIRYCKAPEANITRTTEDGRDVITVDPAKCIACGECVRECVHEETNMNTTTKTQFVPVLSFGKCIMLISKLIDMGIMHNPPLSENEPDKPDTTHVIVYMAGNELNPEGFYSMNILDVASNLSHSYSQQRELRAAIADKNIDIDSIDDPTDLWHETSDALSDLAKAFHPDDNYFSETKRHSYTIIGVDSDGNKHEYCVQYDENTAVYIADSICDYENIGAFADEENTDHFITQVMIINDEDKIIYDSKMKGLINS